MRQLDSSSKWSHMYYPNAPERNEKHLSIVKNRTTNVIFEETSLRFRIQGKEKQNNTFYQGKHK